MRKLAFLFLAVIAAVVTCAAQDSVPQPKTRTVTPVDIDEKKPRTVLHYYDKHGDPLAEPVMFIATLDTVTKAPA